jgi:hypothetical protein
MSKWADVPAQAHFTTARAVPWAVGSGNGLARPATIAVLCRACLSLAVPGLGRTVPSGPEFRDYLAPPLCVSSSSDQPEPCALGVAAAAIP